MGSNMAEAHPVGFQWVMEAKARGARVIHVDPRFTRTSALADQHVTVRAGTDIAFLGGMINYILANNLEKSGTFTNTQRLLQWRDQAVEPTGDQRSELWFFYHLGWRLKEKLAGSADERDRPLLDLAWDYATEGDEPSGADVLRHLRGRRRVHQRPEIRGGAAA